MGSHPTKRKTLDEYFPKSAKAIKTQRDSSSYRTEANAAAQKGEGVPGLVVLHDFTGAAEEKSLLAFLDSQQWRTDLQRRTIHYGGTYCLMPPRAASPATRKRIEAEIITAKPMPKELNAFIDQMVERGLYGACSRPAYCIVNEYLPGQGISAHVENFRFGEPVCSLTLAGGDHMRFHQLEGAHDGSVRSGQASKAPRTGRRVDKWLPRRSLAILTGEARNTWQHEIVRGGKAGKGPGWRRVSLTFRVEKASKEDA